MSAIQQANNSFIHVPSLYSIKQRFKSKRKRGRSYPPGSASLELSPSPLPLFLLLLDEAEGAIRGDQAIYSSES
jgi:hypothetical protein